MAADPFTKRAALSAYLPALVQYRSGRRPDGLPLAMAKLWERWKDRASGDTTQTFTNHHDGPNELCGAIHGRMPVVPAAREMGHLVGRAR